MRGPGGEYPAIHRRVGTGTWCERGREPANPGLAGVVRQPRPPGPAATDKVAIIDFGFNPSAITVKAGTTVTWSNHGRTHTVTADGGSFDSGRIASGATYAMAFKKAGTLAYHCSIHPSMVGQVVVTP